MRRSFDRIRICRFSTLPTPSQNNSKDSSYWRYRHILGLAATGRIGELLVKAFTDKIDTTTYATLLSGRIKCSNEIETKVKIFSALEKRAVYIDERLYEAMISSFGAARDTGKAVLYFNKLLGSGVKLSRLSFNAIIQLDSINAMNYYIKMRQFNITPDIITFKSVLASLGKGDSETAIALFDLIESLELNPSLSIFHSIIRVLISDKESSKATAFFRKLEAFNLQPNGETHNLAIDALSLSDSPSNLIAYVGKMIADGVTLDHSTYLCIVRAFDAFGDSSSVFLYYREMIAAGLYPGIATLEIVIKNCGKTRNVPLAIELFLKVKKASHMPDYGNITAAILSLRPFPVTERIRSGMRHVLHGQNLDLYSIYNSLVFMFIQMREPYSAVTYFELLVQNSINPSLATINSMITVYNRIRQPEKAVQLYKNSINRESGVIVPSILTINAVLKVYRDLKDIKSAVDLFNNLPSLSLIPDKFTFSTMIAIFEKDPEKAEYYYDRLIVAGCKPSSITISTMIHVYTLANNPAAVIKTFDLIKQNSLQLDYITYSTMITSFCKFQDIKSIYTLFAELESSELEIQSHLFYTIINALDRAGDMDGMIYFFNKTKSPPLNIYKLFISHHAKMQNWKGVVEWFERMVSDGIYGDPEVKAWAAIAFEKTSISMDGLSLSPERIIQRKSATQRRNQGTAVVLPPQMSLASPSLSSSEVADNLRPADAALKVSNAPPLSVETSILGPRSQGIQMEKISCKDDLPIAQPSCPTNLIDSPDILYDSHTEIADLILSCPSDDTLAQAAVVTRAFEWVKKAHLKSSISISIVKSILRLALHSRNEILISSIINQTISKAAINPELSFWAGFMDKLTNAGLFKSCHQAWTSLTSSNIHFSKLLANDTHDEALNTFKKVIFQAFKNLRMGHQTNAFFEFEVYKAWGYVQREMLRDPRLQDGGLLIRFVECMISLGPLQAKIAVDYLDDGIKKGKGMPTVNVKVDSAIIVRIEKMLARSKYLDQLKRVQLLAYQINR